MSIWQIKFAATVLRRGGVIAYPTEAVWGLGCDPNNAKAVARLLALKQRPLDKGLILVAADLVQVAPYLEPQETQQRDLLEASWPGFQTWIVPDNGKAPSWIRGDHSGVALRVSAYPLVQQLCWAFGGPLVSTSANLTGYPAARNRLQVARYFKDNLDYVLCGETAGAQQASPIMELTTGRPLRQG